MGRLGTLALLILAFALTGTASADVIVQSDSGEEFPAALTWNDPGGGDGVALRATGTGLRKKAITMRFLRKVGAAKIMDAFREGIRKTLPEGHDEAVNAFAGFFDENIKKGAELELRYLPGKGLSSYRDGRPLGTIDDEAVISALWATWFGDQPISDDLKQGLAGL